MSIWPHRIRRGLIFLAVDFLACEPVMAHDSGQYALDFHLAPHNTMAWGLLSKVGIHRENGSVIPQFLPPLLAMEGRSVVLYGYMTAKTNQKPQQCFLLSPRPILCADCDPIGPEEIVEIVLDHPVPPTELALAVRGKLALLKSAPNGLLYRLESARVMPTQPPHSHRKSGATQGN